jgi:hypothetical protein
VIGKTVSTAERGRVGFAGRSSHGVVREAGASSLSHARSEASPGVKKGLKDVPLPPLVGSAELAAGVRNQNRGSPVRCLGCSDVDPMPDASLIQRD